MIFIVIKRWQAKLQKRGENDHVSKKIKIKSLKSQFQHNEKTNSED